MRFRVQQTEQRWWRHRFLFCTQPTSGDRWQCRTLSPGQLDKELRRLGFEDYRDSHEIFSQLAAAVRHYGLGAGYVEYDSQRQSNRGPERFQGDPRL